MTIEQKIEVIKLAKSWVYTESHVGICGLISSAIRKLYPEFWLSGYRCIHLNFPELYRYKTTRTDTDLYWWPMTDRSSRDDVLGKLLNEYNEQNSSIK